MRRQIYTLLIILTLLPTRLFAEPISDVDLKAAFLYNFVLYTNWPKSSAQEMASEITICTMGEEQFGSALERLKSKRIRNKAIILNRLIDIKDTSRCHLLYLAASEQTNFVGIYEQIKDMQVLTVSDFSRTFRPRAAISMEVEDKHLTFKVDMRVVNQSNLVMSSKLLNLAKEVY